MRPGRTFRFAVLWSLSAGWLSGCRTAAPAPGAPHDPGCLTDLASLPPALKPGAGFTPSLRVAAHGTQSYTCLASDAGSAWGPAVPDATLAACEGDDRAQGTHFAGPTWQWSDSSTFVGSKGAGFVALPAPDAPTANVPWLLLPRKSGSDGGLLGTAQFVQRLATVGGQPADQSQSCDARAADAGLTIKVPYQATYIFYRRAE